MVPHVTDVDAISYGRQIGLNTDNASPPTNAYIGRDDVLQVFAATSLAGVFFTVFARVLLPDGTIVPNQWQVSPQNLRNGQSFYFYLAEGFLLSLTVSGTNTTAPGQTFVRVSLIRGTQGANALSQVLVSGYVTGINPLCWPWSPIRLSTDGRGNMRSIVGTTPALGGEVAEVVPFNVLWRLVSFIFTLTTGATVANRDVMLTISDGTYNLMYLTTQSSYALAAGATGVFEFIDNLGPGYSLNTWFPSQLPRELYLKAGWSIQTLVFNLQSTDQISSVLYVVEEWIIG